MNTRRKTLNILGFGIAALAAGLIGTAQPAFAAGLTHPMQIGQQTARDYDGSHYDSGRYNGDRYDGGRYNGDYRREQEFRRQQKFRRQEEIRQERAQEIRREERRRGPASGVPR